MALCSSSGIIVSGWSCQLCVMQAQDLVGMLTVLLRRFEEVRLL